MLYLSFTTTRGDVTVETNLGQVMAWLAGTFAVVPAGREHELIDWDALEERLLRPPSGQE